MKIVIQRVQRADVTVEEKVIGKIGKGYLILFGVGEDDTEEKLQRYVDKIVKMRIFADENGKTNLSIKDVKGEMLIVSQFTLYADCKKGNRPSFVHAGEPIKANKLYERFVELMKEQIEVVETGEFGADMQVSLVNDGPFTIILDDETVGA
ncbi:MAG: D-aminoacyl-tRNA deacylase [Lachnospiraceae bacterium]|uniref:D-aminoacyl-tRNA deacylase n=1 Tax=Falcatimonas sp. MSJ-15 TaxID=2841515 RepID=UPI001C112673|nr:D-aminoacyl-tRNA deacylase [Falcatimonas sp. MSJ-15]MBQ5735576.1 D-tyrosyl-tRNA(Tyr) deacylase [Lachnospiraceae bacterium]MBU5469576.1 D-tyrosyl-tRNA(Tyr) deacylase [Falcatimonas sp. MSJ-15]MEE0959300.1 D-aminoacyl-tRNA deacylase [Lachnospiraceae bacterium]